MTVIIIVGFFLQYSMCAPTALLGQGNIWTYPVYDTPEMQSWFVFGTWSWLYALTFMTS